MRFLFNFESSLPSNLESTGGMQAFVRCADIVREDLSSHSYIERRLIMGVETNDSDFISG